MQNFFDHPVHCRYVNKIEQALILRYRHAVAGAEALGFVLGKAFCVLQQYMLCVAVRFVVLSAKVEC